MGIRSALVRNPQDLSVAWPNATNRIVDKRERRRGVGRRKPNAACAGLDRRFSRDASPNRSSPGRLFFSIKDRDMYSVLFGEIDGFSVTGIRMPDDAHAGVGG